VVYEYLIYDRPEDGIARITFNRPEVLNAFHIPMIEEIQQAAKEAAEDDSVVVLVYRGAGRAFCAGRDFKYSGKLQTGDPEGWYAWRRRFHGTGPETWLHPKATIAQVHGYALGGGQNLAAACDITIAAEDARFGYPEARYGLLFGGMHIWNWLMGPKKTKEYVFTGRNFGAREAMMHGLVNQVVPLDGLEKATLDMARDVVTIERRSPGYIRANKAQINSRHLEISNFTTVNPRVAEQIPIETEFIINSVKAQEEFYADVERLGMEKALKQLHSGFTTRE